jgi:hypothetical protein
MKKIIFLLTLIPSITFAAAVASKKTVVFDQVVAVIYLNEAPDLGSKEEIDDAPEIITKQDIERSGFDGRNHTRESKVEDSMLCAKAKSLKMAMSDEDVDRYLEKANMNEEQQFMMASRWFYDGIAEFKAALKDMYLANMSLSYEVESNLVISEADIQSYYDQNPIWLEAEYEIQTSFMPANQNNQAQVQAKLEKFIQTGKGFKNLTWDDAIVLKTSEISAANQFLADLSVGQVYLKQVSDGFDLFKMVLIRPLRLQPLVERRIEIVNHLRQERHPQVVEQVKKDLQAKSSVYYPVQY